MRQEYLNLEQAKKKTVAGICTHIRDLKLQVKTGGVYWGKEKLAQFQVCLNFISKMRALTLFQPTKGAFKSTLKFMTVGDGAVVCTSF